MPALNTEGMFGATYNARDGHANPFHTTRAYAQAFERLGGEANYFTEVTGIERFGSKITRVKTNKGDIDTPVLINAAGPWAAPVASMVGLGFLCIQSAIRFWLLSLLATCLIPCSCRSRLVFTASRLPTVPWLWAWEIPMNQKDMTQAIHGSS